MSTTDLPSACVFSKIGQTVALARRDDDVVAFINGTPIYYRHFTQMLIARAFDPNILNAGKTNAIIDGVEALLFELRCRGVEAFDPFEHFSPGPTTKIGAAKYNLLIDRLNGVLLRPQNIEPIDFLKAFVRDIEDRYADVLENNA